MHQGNVLSYHLKHNLFLLSLPFLLMACGGGSSSDSNNPPSIYTVGVSVSGLVSGQSLIVKNNGGDALTVNSNSAFTFATALSSGSTYSVTVSTQPVGQSCSVTNSSGTIATSNVSNVLVSCTLNPYTIAVSDPSAASVSITGTTQVNAPSTATSITFNDTFGDSNVTVSAIKAGNTCTVGGTAIPNPITGNVTGVTVSCTPNPFTIAISNPAAASVSITGTTQVNAPSTATSITFIDTFGDTNVTVSASKTGNTCSVGGTAIPNPITGNVTGVTVSCTPNPFTIAIFNPAAASVSITGTTQVNAPSSATSITFNDTYGDTNVTVSASKAGNTCTVGGTVIPSPITGNVTGVTVSCTPITHKVSGTITGYSTTGILLSLTLTDTTTSSSIQTLSSIASATASFNFTTGVPEGHNWTVTVATQPAGQTCLTFNGSGSNISTDVTNVTLSCSSTTYTIGGTVSGLGTGLSVSLLNNGGDALSINANGSFQFTSALASGATFAVTVDTQPTGQICTVTAGTGATSNSNISNVVVSCNNAGCSSATNASPLNNDPLWAIYSSPTDPSTRTTPSITGELVDPFGACQGP